MYIYLYYGRSRAPERNHLKLKNALFLRCDSDPLNTFTRTLRTLATIKSSHTKIKLSEAPFCVCIERNIYMERFVWRESLRANCDIVDPLSNNLAKYYHFDTSTPWE